jgi:hypothetical protein
LSLIALWARAFALTTAVEILVALPLLGATGRLRRCAAAVLLGQLATHPAVWFIFPELHLPRPSFLIVAETWAVVVEAFIYRFSLAGLPGRRALAASALANAASFGVGLWLGA